MKKLLACALALARVSSLGACKKSSSSAPASSGGAPASGGSVYYLNFKPEIAPVYDKIAAAYEAETGVRLHVVTAASGTYEQTLKSEIAKADAPTLFQINGPKGYAHWKDYCADLSGTELVAHLTDPSLAVSAGGKIYAIPYVVEGYGILYNDAILQKYFATPGAKAKSVVEINSFAALKSV
ncbi:MAG: extracellular solute-binding protein, partial [Oscillospiraceae bacterium]